MSTQLGKAKSSRIQQIHQFIERAFHNNVKEIVYLTEQKSFPHDNCLGNLPPSPNFKAHELPVGSQSPRQLKLRTLLLKGGLGTNPNSIEKSLFLFKCLSFAESIRTELCGSPHFFQTRTLENA